MIRHQDYLDISQSPDRRTFDGMLVKFAQTLEFGLVSAALVVERPGREAIFVTSGNRPEGFLEASKNLSDSKRDPVLRRMKRLNVPFIYDQSLYVSEGAADLWDAQAQFGYHTGIAMALHLPAGKHFLLGVDRDKPLPRSDSRLTRMLADLQLLAVHAQDAAVRLFGFDDAVIADVPHLTSREKEVLKWTMEGKSAREVADILGMSENTVNFHLRNVMTRMDVSSKHQAVRKAVAAGLI
jgi:DNA-binding CsgD family transcriptional regulator